MAKPEQVVEVMLGPAGLHRFLRLYRDAPNGAEVCATLGGEGPKCVLLLEVAGQGTMIPACDAESLAMHLRDFPWTGEAQAAAMRSLAELVQAAADEWAAAQGPKH